MNDVFDAINELIEEDDLFTELLEKAIALSLWVWIVIGAVFCFLMTPFVLAGLAIRNASKK